MYSDKFNIRDWHCRAERLGPYVISVQCEYNHSIFYSVANAPNITSLQLIEPGILRVEWSRPVGGAPVVGYTVHYNGSDGSVGIDSTSVNINGIKNNHMYTI